MGLVFCSHLGDYNVCIRTGFFICLHWLWILHLGLIFGQALYNYSFTLHYSTLWCPKENEANGYEHIPIYIWEVINTYMYSVCSQEVQRTVFVLRRYDIWRIIPSLTWHIAMAMIGTFFLPVGMNHRNEQLFFSLLVCLLICCSILVSLAGKTTALIIRFISNWKSIVHLVIQMFWLSGSF